MTLHYHTIHTCIALHCITLHYITSHYITLHYITLHYITLHYITLHYIHYITLHYITLHYITLHYITSHHITSHTYITLHYIALHCITLHYTTLHYITLRYITLHYHTYLHYITLHCIALHCITLLYITLHYITLHYIWCHIWFYGEYTYHDTSEHWIRIQGDVGGRLCCNWAGHWLQHLAKNFRWGGSKSWYPSEHPMNWMIYLSGSIWSCLPLQLCVLSHGFPLSSILAPAHLWIIQARNSEHHADKPSVPRMNQLVPISTWKSSFCEFKRNEFSGTNRAPSSAQNDWSIGWDQDLFNRLAVTDLVQEWMPNLCKEYVNMSNWAIPSLTCIKIQDLPPAFYRAWHLAYSEMGLSHEGQDISNNVCLIRLIGKLWRRDMCKQTTNLQVTIAFNALVRHHGLLWALWSFQRIVSMGTCEDHLVTWGLHTAKCPFSDETAQPFDSFLFLAWHWWLVMQCHTASKTSDGAWLKE